MLTSVQPNYRRKRFKMGWTIILEAERLFLATEEGKKCRDEKSNIYPALAAVGGGRTSEELWFKFTNDKKGKRMLRNSFVSTSEFAKVTKLKPSSTNAEFVTILMEHGLEKIIKNSNKRKTNSITWPDADGLITPVYNPSNLELVFLREKSAGQFTVPVNQVINAIPAFAVRQINNEWARCIHDQLKSNPSPLVTRIPVLLDRHQVETCDQFTEDHLKNKAIQLYALGGNHLLKAVKTVLEENPGNENFACLRKIDVEVFCGLTNLEARFVGSQHNLKNSSLKPTFQDKVMNCRGIYEAYKTSSEIHWKEACARSLGILEGQEKNKDGIPVILAVASYSETNYNYVCEMFKDFETKNKMGTSFPQVLFKNLLAVQEDRRTPFLAAAVGTNGVKQAKLVLQANKERILQQLLAKSLGVTVDEAFDTHSDEMEAIKQFSDIDVTKAKVPRCVLEFIHKVKENETTSTTDINIEITIKINDKEVTGFEKLKKQMCRKIAKIAKKNPDTEE